MKDNYEKLLKKWQEHYITIESLRQWVKINAIKPNMGITPEEFKQITGIDY